MPEWEECPLKGGNGSVEVCNHAPQRSCRVASEQGPSAWGQALRVCGACVVSALRWLATDGASGKELDSSASHTPSSLPPLFPPFFPLSFLSPSLSLLFSHHLLYPRPVQDALIVLCPSEDALRHWVIAQAASSVRKDPAPHLWLSKAPSSLNAF